MRHVLGGVYFMYRYAFEFRYEIFWEYVHIPVILVFILAVISPFFLFPESTPMTLIVR